MTMTTAPCQGVTTVAALEVLHEAFCMGSFTCDEAETLADLYRSAGLTRYADQFMEAHAYTDTEPTDRHEPMSDAPGWRLRPDDEGGVQ